MWSSIPTKQNTASIPRAVTKQKMTDFSYCNPALITNLEHEFRLVEKKSYYGYYYHEDFNTHKNRGRSGFFIRGHQSKFQEDTYFLLFVRQFIFQ